MPQSGSVYVLRLAGYRPRPGGPSGLVKVGCSSDVARRASGLSTPEGLAEFLPEATLHPLLYSSAELAALARKRYLPAELVLVSGATPNKYALEKTVHGDQAGRLEAVLSERVAYHRREEARYRAMQAIQLEGEAI